MRRKSYSKTEEIELLKNISLFLSKGYKLSQCFFVIARRFNMDEEFELLKNGAMLSEVLAINDFDKDVVLIINIAERSGNLNSGVERAYILLKQKQNNKNQVIEMVKYPMLLAVIMFCALMFIIIFLIPQFKSIYISFGIEPGILIKVIFNIIYIFPISIIVMFICMLLIFLIYKSKDQIGQLKMLFKIRKIKNIYLLLYNQLFVINISNLLLMGLRIDEALTILINQDNNLLLKNECIRIKSELENGCFLYEAIDNDYYLDDLKLMIKEGEQYQMLNFNLINYVELINEVRQKRTEKLIFLIQPIFYLIFGVIIILLYVSIFMPMFEMMDQF